VTPARLRRSDSAAPGIARVRAGRGFTYRWPDGRRVEDAEVLARIRSLVIPPAWTEVWICPYPNGHLQAVGTDTAGRRQYRYHDRWTEQRAAGKHERVLDLAERLPAARRRVDADLALRAMPRERALAVAFRLLEHGFFRVGSERYAAEHGTVGLATLRREHVEHDLAAIDKLTRERVLACAVRLLDRGFFRIGTEEYTVTNESYGLATMRKTHVTVEPDGTMVFDYPAKSGKRRIQAVVDPLATEIVSALKRRRGGGTELLAYKQGRRWVDVRSPDINAYLKEATGGDFSAKDFRTWSATVLAALALAVSGPAHGSKTSRSRAITRAIRETSHYLGNTPAVCRASYIDPRVFDAFRAGLVIDREVLDAALDAEPGELPIHHPAIERAVLDLVDEREASPGVEKVAA